MSERRSSPRCRLAASLCLIASAACSSSASSDRTQPRAAALVFQVQPAAVTAGATQPAPVAVGVVDSSGAPVPAALDVTVSISSGPVDAAMLGTVTVRSVNGVAVFPTLAYPRAGTHRLRADAGGLSAATSDPFVVSPGPAVALAFAGLPTAATVRAELTPPPFVIARDALGNDVALATVITLAAQDGPAPLSGTTTRTAPGGNATFAGLSLADEGTYRLAATAASLDPALSPTFAVVDDLPPASPVDLAATLPTIHGLHVSWTATGDDGFLGTAAAWELRRSTSPITLDSFAAATLVATGAASAAGLPESVDVTGLDPGTTYELGLRVVDGAGNAAFAISLGTTAPCPEGYAGPDLRRLRDGIRRRRRRLPPGGGARARRTSS